VYESFFGFREPPFSLSPDPHFLWLSETHSEGLAALCYAISSRKGITLLTGGVGAGKTTLLRAALARLPRNTEVAVVTNTAELGALDLLKFLHTQTAVAGRPRTRVDHLIALQAHLLARLEAGGDTVLVIDEAQNLGLGVLEHVRLLSNLETDREKLVQIVLCGQPELREKLAHPRLGPLRQRIEIEFHLEPLRPDEVLTYLRHRIVTAGGRYFEVFEAGIEPIFYTFSGGCPRRINLLADHVLLSAYAQGQRPVTRTLVERRARELAATRALPLVKADGEES
jgi:general secretion pathway protein A